MVSIDTGGERTGGMVRLVGYLLPEANGNGISGLRTRSGDSELGYRGDCRGHVYRDYGDVLIDELNHVQFGDTGYMYVANDENRYFYHPDPSMYGRQSRIKPPRI